MSNIIEITEPVPTIGPFMLFDILPTDLDSNYIGFVFTATPNEAQAKLLSTLQNTWSREVHYCCKHFIKYFKELKPSVRKKKLKKVKAKTSKSDLGKIGSLVAHGKRAKSKNPLTMLKGVLKKELLERGWSGRNANSIITEAYKIVKGRIAQAKNHIKVINKKLKVVTNHSKLARLRRDLKYWKEVGQGLHILFVKKDLHKALAQLGQKLAAFDKTDTKGLTELKDTIVVAREEFDKAKLLPITQVGYGKESTHGQWTGNKTICLLNNDNKLSLLVKVPAIVSGRKTTRMEEIVIPINEMKPRNLDLYNAAVKAKKAITYQLNFVAGKLVCYGTYALDKGPVLPFNKQRRIGIDQNAGFITVALIEGKQVICVRKLRMKQKGCAEARMERIFAVVKILMALSVKESAPIVIEDINLVGKKTRSKVGNRKVSSIPYGSFQSALSRLAYTAGVTVKVVNPCHTSTFAKVSYPNMDVHLGAAIMIARRNLGIPLIKERVVWAKDGTGVVKINLGDADKSPVVKVSKEWGKMLRSKRNNPLFWVELITLAKKKLNVVPTTKNESVTTVAVSQEKPTPLGLTLVIVKDNVDSSLLNNV